MYQPIIALTIHSTRSDIVLYASKSRTKKRISWNSRSKHTSYVEFQRSTYNEKQVDYHNVYIKNPTRNTCSQQSFGTRRYISFLSRSRFSPNKRPTEMSKQATRKQTLNRINLKLGIDSKYYGAPLLLHMKYY